MFGGKKHIKGINEPLSGGLELNIDCVVTGERHVVKVASKDWDKYLEGEYVQKAFPYLSTNDRELIISGTSPEGWGRVLGNE